MGGWELSVTNKSKNKDLVWELITIMVDPKIITPFYEKYGLLPTQVSIGDGEYSANLNKTIPYYDQLISMLQLKGVRPNIPEFPQIAEHIRQALDEVLYQSKDPKEVLDNAAAKSARTLGW
jgi:multiple sugar transport system substrate-binding protein